jgi:beta-glucosidase
MYLDGVKVLDYWIDSKPAMFKTIRYKFKAGHLYDLQVEFYENIGSAVCRLGYAAYIAGTMPRDAQKLALASDVVILCLGLNRELEGEANDRQELALPEEQRQLIEEILQVNKNVVVVLNNGTPILMSEWIDKVPAVIEAFYPGQEGGHALADILLGKVNPCGVVPITFPKQWQDCPAFKTYPGEKSLARYQEDILVGYRWFDEYHLEPLFEFGHGLSYTTFAYKNLVISPSKFSKDQSVAISFDLVNTGRRSGAKAVQLYVQDVAASVPREKKSLKGFAKIELAPRETKKVSFTLKPTDFSFFHPERRQWMIEPGMFNILIGNSSRDIQLLGKVEYF